MNTNKRPMAGQKRKTADEVGPGNPNKKIAHDTEERIIFACQGGQGRRDKTNDFILKCKRKEITPSTVVWDKEGYLEITKCDSKGNKELLENDTTELLEVITPCGKKSGKTCPTCPT